MFIGSWRSTPGLTLSNTSDLHFSLGFLQQIQGLFSDHIWVRKPWGLIVCLNSMAAELHSPTETPLALGSQKQRKIEQGVQSGEMRSISLLLCSRTGSVCYLQPQNKATDTVHLRLLGLQRELCKPSPFLPSPSSSRHLAGIFSLNITHYF